MNNDEKNQLKKEIKEAIKKQLGENYDVTIQEVAKINVVLDGITILNSNEKTEVVPQIYLNEYYKKYDLGFSVQSIATEIIGLYEISKGKCSFKADDLLCWDNVKDKVVCRLINFQKNKKLLEETTHIRFLDLAIVFYVLVSIETDGMASYRVMNNHY